ncbi:unnamed protein product [Anisakis simplex]|uniref:F-box domain-containing protein n=1 Tax=Anisakis simplex TaxID=6269 RepID=A0A3P6NDE1_ANISI|nr:unnamed protein product [Anisakis simplex]
MYVVFQKDVFFDVFPNCMPHVTFLDIAYFPDLAGCVENLVTCFRHVEVLNLYYVRNIDNEVVDVLFSNDCLKRLRQLHFISMDGKPSNFIPKLCESERPLQLLNVPYSFEQVSSVF